MQFVSCQIKLDLHILLLLTFFTTLKRTDLFLIGRHPNAFLLCLLMTNDIFSITLNHKNNTLADEPTGEGNAYRCGSETSFFC